MSDKISEPNERETPEDEQDVEGHSMLMYEHSRVIQRQREDDVKRHARDARMLEERKNQKR